LRSSPRLSINTKTSTDERPQGVSLFLRLVAVGILIMPILMGGCSHTDEGSLSQEATAFFNQGNYGAALGKYEQLIENHPEVADRVLFEMGIVYIHPNNVQKDYQKSLDCFQKVLSDYPDSEYRHDSQMMILQIHNVIIKDKKIAMQQAALETSRQALESKADEIITLQDKVETLEEAVFTLKMASADKVLIEKQARRLSLLSKGEVIKTYRIALGGNPVGPKERQGDNKTPEGAYTIDSRNGNSGFHLSLHISYPNAQDKKRARELGVSPGGNIMIHGIKNGFAPVGASHAETDWTEGCIAVTNQEMEEIYKFVPNGTVVEITP
jgi:L,D-peptidoglycan transpeptidase YkuD (ErfK/YbiS/YcfS/YnhG family)